MQWVDPVRRARETRRLKVVLLVLALTTAALALVVSAPLGFAVLLAPFAVLALSSAPVLPLDSYGLQRRETACETPEGSGAPRYARSCGDIARQRTHPGLASGSTRDCQWRFRSDAGRDGESGGARHPFRLGSSLR